MKVGLYSWALLKPVETSIPERKAFPSLRFSRPRRLGIPHSWRRNQSRFPCEPSVANQLALAEPQFCDSVLDTPSGRRLASFSPQLKSHTSILL